MDPSMVLGFYIKNSEDFNTFCDDVVEVSGVNVAESGEHADICNRGECAGLP